MKIVIEDHRLITDKRVVTDADFATTCNAHALIHKDVLSHAQPRVSGAGNLDHIVPAGSDS
jgi:hypothetical protein